MAVRAVSIHSIAVMVGLAVSQAGAQTVAYVDMPVENTRPVATIRSPVDGSFYIPGETIALVGIGTDREDGASDLNYSWNVLRVGRGSRAEGLFRFAGPTASFDLDDLMAERDGMLRIELIVMDRKGARDTAFVSLHPSPEDRPARPIGPGDVVHVEVHAGGERQEEFTAKISPEGTITVPLIGGVGVAGLTTSDMSSKIERILARDFFVSPQVLVSVMEQMEPEKVYISGEVKHPGAYAAREGLTVLNACILAGGFTDFAAPNRVTVTRKERGQLRVFTMDLSKVQRGKSHDMTLQSGDRIVVPHRVF